MWDVVCIWLQSWICVQLDRSSSWSSESGILLPALLQPKVSQSTNGLSTNTGVTRAITQIKNRSPLAMLAVSSASPYPECYNRGLSLFLYSQTSTVRILPWVLSINFALQNHIVPVKIFEQRIAGNCPQKHSMVIIFVPKQIGAPSVESTSRQGRNWLVLIGKHRVL